MRGERRDATDWVALDPSPWWMPVLGTNLVSTALFPSVMSLQLTSIFRIPLIWWLPVMIGTAVLTLTGTVVLAHHLAPRGYLDPATSTLRAGRDRIPYEDISEARLLPSSSKKRRSVLLILSTKNRLRASVLLRDAKQRALPPDVTALVHDLILQSNIAMPVSPDDPKGRFARFNFPRNITKQEALELVAHPPMPADELPIINI
jgi:hypothetical protein